MVYPYAQLFGDATVSVTATATGAVNGSTAQNIGISLGLPVIDQIADIAVRFGIPKTSQINAKARPKFKLTYRGNDLVAGYTFAAQGVHSGDSVVLVDIP